MQWQKRYEDDNNHFYEAKGEHGRWYRVVYYRVASRLRWRLDWSQRRFEHADAIWHATLASAREQAEHIEHTYWLEENRCEFKYNGTRCRRTKGHSGAHNI